MRPFVSVLLLLVGCCYCAADDPPMETVTTGLVNPCGVAVQPETGHVFVADSGAGRIIRIVDGQAQEVIVDFPRDMYGKGPQYAIGPLGLVFLDQHTLVVGGGGLPDGEDLVRVYTVPGPGADPLPADQMKLSLGLPADGAMLGEGNFYGVASSPEFLFVTANGDDAKGWIARARRTKNHLGKLERFLATKEAVHADAPTAVTISPRGELVVGQMGELDDATDALLSFYGPKTGALLLNLGTGLYDITSLAYHPISGNLYALDFAWAKPEHGGLFRLDEAASDRGTPRCAAVKIASLDKPTACTFSAAGELYITVIGSTDDATAQPGKLLKLKP
ncbi:MAG: hypothetical protein KDA60_00905 [Planctomycetales bacterium]|nr:hypothetical protein [Planctomycetales bacterium]